MSTITIPLTEWNKLRRDIDAIKKALLPREHSNAGWVRMGVIVKETGLTKEIIRGMRKTHTDMVKCVNKRYLYNLEAFKQTA